MCLTFSPNLTPGRPALGMLFTDVPATPAGHRLQEFTAHPALEHAVGDQHVASTSAVVLAHRDLLVAHANDPVGGNPARHPVVAVALGARADLALRGLEAAHRGGVPKRLVGALGVVVGDPLVDCLLGGLEVGEDLAGVGVNAGGGGGAL